MTVLKEFAIGAFVALDKGEDFIACDRETDSADAGIKIKDFFGLDVFFDFLEGELVDREVDLEETVGRIGVRMVQ